MRTETMPLKISLTVAALPWLLLGCGDLTDGGPSSSPGSIGKLMLVANVPAVAGEPVVTTKRVMPTTGTGSIGPIASPTSLTKSAPSQSATARTGVRNVVRCTTPRGTSLRR